MGMQTSAGDFDGLQGARILLVDDDPFIRKVAARVLAELGASVTSACSGEEALECLTCGQFGCVLMDVQMPGLDGPQTTRLIRASTRLAHLPVIALSANASELDRQRCREAGMDDFIAKPLVRAQLESTLAGWLSAARPAGGDAAGAAVAAPKQWKAPAGDPEIIDLAILSRWVGGDAVRFRLYAQLFVDTGTATLAQLAVARTAADLRQLAALAHRYKASASMVGALGIVARCEAIEAAASDGAIERARELADQIAALSTEAFAAIGAACP